MGGDRRRERAVLGRGEVGASNCNQWGLWCVVVRKCVNLSSCRLEWWVSGVERDMGVLDGGLCASRGRRGFGGFSPHWFE